MHNIIQPEVVKNTSIHELVLSNKIYSHFTILFFFPGYVSKPAFRGFGGGLGLAGLQGSIEWCHFKRKSHVLLCVYDMEMHDDRIMVMFEQTHLLRGRLN